MPLAVAEEDIGAHGMWSTHLRELHDRHLEELRRHVRSKEAHVLRKLEEMAESRFVRSEQPTTNSSTGALAADNCFSVSGTSLCAAHLNIGGDVFCVPWTTLLREPDSLFHVLYRLVNLEEPQQDNHHDGLYDDRRVDTHVLTTSLGDTADRDDLKSVAGPSATEGVAWRPRKGFVQRDRAGAILLNRDGQTFRHILNFLRGYPRLPCQSIEAVGFLAEDALYYGVPRLLTLLDQELLLQASFRLEGGRFWGRTAIALRSRFAFHQMDKAIVRTVGGTENDQAAFPADQCPVSSSMPDSHVAMVVPHRFQLGPSVSSDGVRFRSPYLVAFVGHRFFIAGRHTATFEIVRTGYIGIGVASESVVLSDAEFHRSPGVVVYYYTGSAHVSGTGEAPFRKDGLQKFALNDRVTVTADLDDRFVEFFINDRSELILHLPAAPRFRFAVAMKGNAAVTLVQEGQKR